MKKETDMTRWKRTGAVVLSVSVLATSVAVAAEGVSYKELADGCTW
jgi:hypothetical protein